MPLSENPRENIAYQVRGTFRALENALITYLANTNVSVAYFHILRLSWSKNGIPQKEISNLAFMTPSVTSQLIQKMCKEELLIRGSEDKDSRKKQVFLTEKGWQLRTTILDGALQIPLTATKNTSDEDIETAIKVLNSIRDTLESH